MARSPCGCRNRHASFWLQRSPEPHHSVARQEQLDGRAPWRQVSWQLSALFCEAIHWSSWGAGTLPPGWARLALNCLSVSRNKLTGSLPEAWHQMAALASLDLSFNRVQGEVATELLLYASPAVSRQSAVVTRSYCSKPYKSMHFWSRLLGRSWRRLQQGLL